MLKPNILFAFVAVVAAGCLKTTEDDDFDDDAGVPDSGGGDTDTQGDGGVTSLCQVHPSGTVVPADEQEFSGLLIGRWILCEPIAVAVEAGLELVTDRTWYTLVEVDGELVRSTDPSQTGTWAVTGVPLQYELGLTSNTGTRTTQPVFSNTVRKMRLAFAGESPKDYLLEELPGPDEDINLPFAATYPPLVCQEQGDLPVTLTGHDLEVLYLLQAKWWNCEGSVFTDGFAEIGLEIRENGTWYKLVPAGEGMAIRAQGIEDSGTWEIVDTSDMNGPGSFQLNLTFGQWTIYSGLVFQTYPHKLHLDNMGVAAGVYGRDL